MDFKDLRCKLNWHLWKDIPNMIDKKNLPANFTSGRTNPIDSGKDWKLNFEIWGKSGETHKRRLINVHVYIENADGLFLVEGYLGLDSDANIDATKLEPADLARIRLLRFVFVIIKEINKMIKDNDDTVKYTDEIDVFIDQRGISYSKKL